jgi:hypothetical protein
MIMLTSVIMMGMASIVMVARVVIDVIHQVVKDGSD